MKPEKFIGIMLLTLLLSCEMEEQPACSSNRVDQNIGEVSFETNQYIMNSSFEIDIYIDGTKVENRNSSKSENNLLTRKLNIGIHNYEVKVYTYNGEPSKSIKGRFLIEKDKTSEVFIDFKNYNSWI